MSYAYDEHKTVVLLSSSIDMPTALNVVGHLTLAIGADRSDEIMGRALLPDATGINHHGISRYPVIILKGRAAKVRKAVEEARSAGDLVVVDYPEEMLHTSHDDELASALAGRQEEVLNYLGVAAYGSTEKINAIFGRFTLWRVD
jgi:hypothetical protein